MRPDEHGYVESNGDPQMYNLEDDAAGAPTLPDNAIVKSTPDDVIDVLAADLIALAIECVTEHGEFHLALSARPVFEILYRRLLVDPACRALPWSKTHLWIIDDCGAGPNAGADFAALHDWFGDHTGMPADHLHAIPTSGDAPHEAYEQAMRIALAARGEGGERLDYILLTMDTDGATAGMTPECGIAHDDASWVRIARGAESPADDRITMTAACINAARLVAVLVIEPKLGPLVRSVIAGDAETADTPIGNIKPRQGKLRWYLDSVTGLAGT